MGGTSLHAWKGGDRAQGLGQGKGQGVGGRGALACMPGGGGQGAGFRAEKWGGREGHVGLHAWGAMGDREQGMGGRGDAGLHACCVIHDNHVPACLRTPAASYMTNTYLCASAPLLRHT